MESTFDIPYMIRVLYEIYGREHGMDIKVNATPKEEAPKEEPVSA